jgi:hypothetical protein
MDCKKANELVQNICSGKDWTEKIFNKPANLNENNYCDQAVILYYKHCEQIIKIEECKKFTLPISEK